MHCVLMAVVLLAPATTDGAEKVPMATGVLGGKKVRFPEQGLAAGAKATLALLESCRSLDDGSIPYTLDDLKKAQGGDHVRLVFAQPVPVTVLGEKFEVTEVVFTQPSNTGVFWLRSGDRVRRASKFEFERHKVFDAWVRQAQPADGR